MIITKEILNEKVPMDKIPTRLDSALNLYTNIKYKMKKGLLLYNSSPSTWNCLYSFYETKHKFTINEYHFFTNAPTYGELIKEYQEIYQKIYEQEKGFTKEVRKEILINEYKKTFQLEKVSIVEELEPIFELKYSKSQKVWTLYYFENYVANTIENIYTLLNQKLYEQKILPLNHSNHKIDGIEIGSNIPYMLSVKTNLQKLNKNTIEIED